MSDDLIPIPLSIEQKAFIIRELAMNTDVLTINNKFKERWPTVDMSFDYIMRISQNKEYKELIYVTQQEIYSDLSTLPMAFEWNQIALASSRIRYLLENPKYVKSKRVIKDGTEAYEDVNEIDEENIRGYLDFIRRVGVDNRKHQLERLLNNLDKNHPTLPAAGLKPVQINVGFTVAEEDANGSEE